MPQQSRTVRVVETTVRSAFSEAEVANILYGQLPDADCIPGSPLLKIECDTNGFVLVQKMRSLRNGQSE